MKLDGGRLNDDKGLLAQMVDEGYISVQHHPTADLHIYNYSKKTQWEGRWNEATIQCRGLILTHDGYVIARPFKKFFNMEEHSRSDLIWRSPFKVQEKVDGSLGIAYMAPDGPAIATRGSFTSDQAIKGTQILRDKYSGICLVLEASDHLNDYPVDTLLFEIIYPENRIVVNYYNQEELVLLAIINNLTGEDEELDPELWKDDCPIVHTYDLTCKPSEVIEKLGLPDDGSHEGAVLVFDYPKGSKTRVKVKLEEYKRLHRILTGFSNKTVWEHLSSGGKVEELVENIPDEFFAWLTKTRNELYEAFMVMRNESFALYSDIVMKMGDELGDEDLAFWQIRRSHRKRFAELAKETKYPGHMFCWLDQQQERVDQDIWKRIRPVYARPFTTDIDA